MQYRNSESMKPAIDDILVFTDTKYGHVAIITEVSTNEIEVIQQNIYGKPRDKFALTYDNGVYFIGSESKKPAAWLRKE